MHNVALTWQQAGWLTAALALASLALPYVRAGWSRATLPFIREASVISGLYALWQLAGSLSVLGTTGAFSRARWIVRVEHDAGLPSEARFQHLVTHHPLVVQACNLYYATMHFGVLFAFLLWAFLRHRDAYRRARATLVLLTLTCLLIQLVPVAPPRLLPGFIDTASQYGQSVYSLGLAPDQLSAMPSVHVGWAVLVAWTVIRASTSRWRWLAVVHPLATVFVVTATANHFWLDGVVAIALLVACMVLQRVARDALLEAAGHASISRWRRPVPPPESISAPREVLAASATSD
ncbi:MAG: phosphatase PAP2 family protein [Actinomycetota bacterium]|nr:phosphatase PAP2 family protein [Actinomycetota bacterium]